MFRFNNPDALLVLLLTLAAYALTRAVEKAGARWLALVGVLVGFAFLTKMLQALLVVPAFALVYLVAAPTTLRRRVLHVLGAGLALLVSAGWWVAVVELVPDSWRPYIGGSQTNSVWELIWGYNGLGRLTGDETGSVGGRRRLGRDRHRPALHRRHRRPGRLAAARGSGARRRRAGRRRPRAAHRPAPCGAAAVGWLAGGHRRGVQPDGRHLPRVLHGGPRPGDRGARRHRRRRCCGSAAVACGRGSCWRRPWPARSLWAWVLLARSADYYPWLKWLVLVAGLVAAVGLLVADRVGRAVAATLVARRPPGRARRTGRVRPRHRGDGAHRLDPQRRAPA